MGQETSNWSDPVSSSVFGASSSNANRKFVDAQSHPELFPGLFGGMGNPNDWLLTPDKSRNRVWNIFPVTIPGGVEPRSDAARVTTSEQNIYVAGTVNQNQDSYLRAARKSERKNIA